MWLSLAVAVLTAGLATLSVELYLRARAWEANVIAMDFATQAKDAETIIVTQLSHLLQGGKDGGHTLSSCRAARSPTRPPRPPPRVP